jgi:MFS family permease
MDTPPAGISPKPVLLVAVMLTAQMLTMVPFACWPVTLSYLSTQWGLSNAQAGIVGGAYFTGYIIAAPVLVGLTDTVDARRIYLFSAALTLASVLAFATLVNGYYGAIIAWAAAGAGLAGTYMPGLQILNSRFDAKTRVRFAPWYTAGFSIGSGSSFIIIGLLADYHSWQNVYLLAAVGPFLGGLLVLGKVLPKAPVPQAVRRNPLDFRPVLKNRRGLSYLFGYLGHTYELFAYRTWIFVLIIQAGALSGFAISSSVGAVIAGIYAYLGVAASLIGAAYALRIGRDRALDLFMTVSIVLGVMTGLVSGQYFLIFCIVAGIYSISIMTDSGALTAGVVEVSAEDERGAMLAAHTFLGFLGASLGPPAVGLALDLGGGATNPDAWLWAFVAMAVGSVFALASRRWLLRGGV